MKLIAKPSSNIKIEVKFIKDFYLLPYIKKTVRFVGVEATFLMFRFSIMDSEKRWR